MLESAARDPFEPLDIGDAQPPPAAQDAWVPITPIPDDAGEPPPAWVSTLVPSSRHVACWTYCDQDGRRLAYVARFILLNGDGTPKLDEHGRQEKDFRPITFCAGP